MHVTLERIMSRLDHIEGKIDHLINRMRYLMATVDDIQAQLEEVFQKATDNSNALDSIVIAFDGLRQTIDALNVKVGELQAIIDAGGTANLQPIQAGLTAVSAKLDEMAQKESVLVNTGAV